MSFTESKKKTIIDYTPKRGGGGVHPIMAYVGRPGPKGVPFLGFRYMKQ